MNHAMDTPLRSVKSWQSTNVKDAIYLDTLLNFVTKVFAIIAKDEVMMKTLVSMLNSVISVGRWGNQRLLLRITLKTAKRLQTPFALDVLCKDTLESFATLPIVMVAKDLAI